MERRISTQFEIRRSGFTSANKLFLPHIFQITPKIHLRVGRVSSFALKNAQIRANNKINENYDPLKATLIDSRHARDIHVIVYSSISLRRG
jgi:hypothetical protein